MKLGSWLVGLVPSLIAKVLLSLGLSVVTITGVSAAIDVVKNLIISNFNALPSPTYNLFLLAGGGIGIGIVFGAITFSLSMFMLRKATSIISKPAG